MKQTFGQRLRELRKKRDMIQRELAERVAARLKDRGFDVTYLSKIENDKLPPPSTKTIIELAAVLQVDSDELLALAGKVPPDLGETLKQSEAARMFYRLARDRKLTEEDWKNLRQELERAKKRK